MATATATKSKPPSIRRQKRVAKEKLHRIRVRCGLANPDWLRLLGLSREADAFDGAEVNLEVIRRARDIARKHTVFINRVNAAVDAEFKRAAFQADGVKMLSTVQVARALGIGDYHISNLRERGRLSAVKLGRGWGYTRESVRELIVNERQLGYHSPLTGAFLRFLDDVTE